jgi:MFS family permease
MLSAIVGGYAAFHYGWRVACILIGLPGIAVALLIRRLIQEPPRGNSEPLGTAIATQPPAESHQALPPGRTWLGDELKEMAQVGRVLLFKRPIANMLTGLILASFAAQGSYAFAPAYFSRAFGLDYATIGLISAVTGGATVGLGLAAGGVLSDLLGARDAKWYALVPAIGLTIALPLYVVAFLQTGWKMSAVFLGAAGFFQYLSFGPTLGVVQNAVDSRRRATATAIVYILLTVISLGFGPPFTGWLIDRFAEIQSSHLASTTVSGWFAPSTLALSSREGIIVTVLLYAWAVIHYLLGSLGLSKEMRGA